jgi:putative DNA primase/helicase
MSALPAPEQPEDDQARAQKARKIFSGLDGFRLPEHCEDELADLFSIAYAIDLKYVAAWNKWLWWDGARWRIEKTKLPFDLARGVCRGQAKLLQKQKQAEKDKLAAAIASAATVAAVVRLASADRRHALVPEQLDTDPFLTNTPGGTVNTRIGKMQPHRREDLITKVTAVAPDDDADDSTWQCFLDAITCGRKALQDFLQRVAGMCLTGDTRDHVLLFFLGTGANGKSTFLDLMLYILGDYARQILSELLLERRGESHPTEIANLMGVRLAVASELAEGQSWNEARIKSLTGDENMSGRFVRQDFFQFPRTHKLVVAGNNRPALRSVDDAMRRRLLLVPFDAHFAGDQADPDMPAKLRAEAPAILAWAVRGALAWQSGGLCPPAEVTGATEDYLLAQDTLGEWIAQACDTSDHEAETPSSELYTAFHRWKERRGERAPSTVRFSSQLQARFRKERRSGIVRFQGIRLVAPELKDGPQEG